MEKKKHPKGMKAAKKEATEEATLKEVLQVTAKETIENQSKK